MVSSDEEVLITDFGFATVGHFGPPPMSTRKSGSIPSMANTAGAAEVTADRVPKLTGVDASPSKKRNNDDVGASAHSHNIALDADSGGKGSTTSPGLNTRGGEENDGPQTSASEPGYDGSSNVRNVCTDVNGGMTTPAKSTPEAKHATDGGVLAVEAANAQCSNPTGGARVAPATAVAQLATADSVGSTPIGVGEVRRGQGGRAGKESGAQKSQGARQRVVDIARPPNRDSVLYGTIKGYTPRYQSPEVSEIMENKCKRAAAAAATARASDQLLHTHATQVSMSSCLYPA